MKALDRFSEVTRAKGTELVESGAMKPDESVEHVFRYKDYVTQVHEGGLTTCTCPNGLNRTISNCYHSAAAIMLTPDLEEQDDEDGDETYEGWEVIE